MNACFKQPLEGLKRHEQSSKAAPVEHLHLPHRWRNHLDGVIEDHRRRRCMALTLAGGDLHAPLLQLSGDLTKPPIEARSSEALKLKSLRTAANSPWAVCLILMIIHLRELQLLQLRCGWRALQGLVLQAHVHELRLQPGVLLGEPLDLRLLLLVQGREAAQQHGMLIIAPQEAKAN